MTRRRLFVETVVEALSASTVSGNILARTAKAAQFVIMGTASNNARTAEAAASVSMGKRKNIAQTVTTALAPLKAARSLATD